MLITFGAYLFLILFFYQAYEETCMVSKSHVIDEHNSVSKIRVVDRNRMFVIAKDL